MIARVDAWNARIAAPRVELPARVPDEVHAKNLVHGIARMHEVTLFHDGPVPQDAEDPQRLILDILTELGVTAYRVDVSADRAMAAGIPNADAGGALPYLYLDGLPIGGPSEVLDEVRSGALAKRLTRAGIAFDTEVAKALSSR